MHTFLIIIIIAFEFVNIYKIEVCECILQPIEVCMCMDMDTILEYCYVLEDMNEIYLSARSNPDLVA